MRIRIADSHPIEAADRAPIYAPPRARVRGGWGAGAKLKKLPCPLLQIPGIFSFEVPNTMIYLHFPSIGYGMVIAVVVLWVFSRFGWYFT